MRSASRRLLARLHVVLAASLLVPALAGATTVRLSTSVGPVDINLYDSGAPANVANFLSYVRSNAYDGTFLHRSIPGFVVQGGGYAVNSGTNSIAHITAAAPVVNEFSSTRSNVRGTVAMAKLGGDPNSATTEWFFNLADNAANLDNQNGGFTVFGKVTTPGMVVVDAMAALQVINASTILSALSNLPVINYTASNGLLRSNLVYVNTARVLPAPANNAERAFNYLEAVYWQYLKPPYTAAGKATVNGVEYSYRYYADSSSYVGVGTQDNVIYYLVPAVNNQINRLAPVADLLPTITSAGY